MVLYDTEGQECVEFRTDDPAIVDAHEKEDFHSPYKGEPDQKLLAEAKEAFKLFKTYSRLQHPIEQILTLQRAYDKKFSEINNKLEDMSLKVADISLVLRELGAIKQILQDKSQENMEQPSAKRHKGHLIDHQGTSISCVMQ